MLQVRARVLPKALVSSPHHHERLGKRGRLFSSEHQRYPPAWIPRSQHTRARFSVDHAHPHQRVHPEHAEIPALPARYSPTSDYYWHFGFPVSIAEVRAVLEEWAPSRVRMYPTDDDQLMRDLLVMANRIWPLTKLFDVQPEEGSADNMQTIHETLDNRRAVSFYSLMSTEKEHFISRPVTKRVEALTTLFGKQPVWREDAIEKRIWADHYDEHYDSDDDEHYDSADHE